MPGGEFYLPDYRKDFDTDDDDDDDDRARDDAVRYANEVYSFDDSDSTTERVPPARVPPGAIQTTTVLRRRSAPGAERDRRGTAGDADQGWRERVDDDDECRTVVLPKGVKFIIH